jgi:hypothetical protein
MATTNCQNDEILLAIANQVGRKAYLMGLDINFNRHWYSPVERDAFVLGWLAAAEESSPHGPGAMSFSHGTSSLGPCFMVH